AEVVIIKAIGIGLAIAVAIDATIVRSLVVPAVMRLLGDANWWAPRPLRWAYDRIGIGDLGVEPIGSPHPAATPPTSPASGEVKVAVGARGPSVWLRQTPPHGMGGLTIGPVPTLSSDDAFAEVKAKVDLVKVVQEHVRLTKRNKDFWGLCPFHQEDSPSFKVNPQMQSWYCFGCERSGDVFTFVELIEKTDKRGALQLLAERAGVELKKLSPDQREGADLRKRVLDMLKLAAQYYEYVLWKTPVLHKRASDLRAGPGARRQRPPRPRRAHGRAVRRHHQPPLRGDQRRGQLGHGDDRRPGPPAQTLHRPASPRLRLGPGRPRGDAKGGHAGCGPRHAHASRHPARRQGSGRVLARGRARRRHEVGGPGRPGGVRLRGRHGRGLGRVEPEQPQ